MADDDPRIAVLTTEAAVLRAELDNVTKSLDKVEKYVEGLQSWRTTAMVVIALSLGLFGWRFSSIKDDAKAAVDAVLGPAVRKEIAEAHQIAKQLKNEGLIDGINARIKKVSGVANELHQWSTHEVKTGGNGASTNMRSFISFIGEHVHTTGGDNWAELHWVAKPER